MRQLGGCHGNETLIIKGERHKVVNSSTVQDLAGMVKGDKRL